MNTLRRIANNRVQAVCSRVLDTYIIVYISIFVRFASVPIALVRADDDGRGEGF